MGRRGPDDLEWQKAKEEVWRRDGKRCCLCHCLTFKELQERKDAGYCFQSFSIIDPAHWKPVGTNIKLMYDPDNIFALCRSCHNSLDHMYSPINGTHIKQDEVDAYWERIRATRNESSGPELEEFFY